LEVESQLELEIVEIEIEIGNWDLELTNHIIISFGIGDWRIVGDRRQL
jgi:hypothetical protein